jgi:hypothetical protein
MGVPNEEDLGSLDKGAPRGAHTPQGRTTPIMGFAFLPVPPLLRMIGALAQKR